MTVALEHLSALELRLAHYRLKATRAAIEKEGPPIAAIIGEAPGPRTSPKLPLFPLPATSAAGRLLEYSGLTAAEYLGRFFRCNVFDQLAPWSARSARARADELRHWLLAERRVEWVVLLGTRVGAAFGVEDLWGRGVLGDAKLVVLPHPSGRNRVYNEQGSRARAGWLLRCAAGYRGG